MVISFSNKRWYYYHGSNEQRVIEKIRLLFFVAKEGICAIIRQINKSEVVEMKKGEKALLDFEKGYLK